MQNIVDFFSSFDGAFSSWMVKLSTLPYTKIVVAILLFLFFLALRRIFALFVIKILKKFFDKTENKIDDKSIVILLGPVSFIFIIIGFNAFLAMLDIHTDLSTKISKSLVVFNIFWFLYLLIELFKTAFSFFTKQYSQTLSQEISKFLTRIFKIIVISVGTMSLLQVWSINVTGFVASLGLGGLAFALAAKDAAANIFGSIAIIADKAISVGEWIKVDGVEGTVMDIGMRTTKIKSFENAIITMPNQIIANSKIINYSRRKERRIKARIGLTYDTSSNQMQKILQDIKAMLQSNEGVSQKSTMIVNFERFDDSSLTIFLYFFANTANWTKYLDIKEELNLNIIRIVEDNDASFAFPSQTIYIENSKEDQS